MKLFLFFILLSITSCTMEPRYKTPKSDVPFAIYDDEKKDISQVSWKEFFKSPELQRIIQAALDNNRDLKVAELNIESARQMHNIARSNLLPTINATALETRQGVPGAFASFTPKKQFRANVSLAAYEVDLFGRLRSLKKAALENLLASQEARNVIKISLITETANSYAQLLLDCELLKIAQDNLNVQDERYKFVMARNKKGIDSGNQLLNAESLMENARINYENYKNLVEQDKHALMLLVGKFEEGFLPKDDSINNIEIAEELFDFVASSSLLSRPDIRQAEHELKSANANIGAARAAFFPTISLTGTYGYGSRALETLFDSRSWVFTPQVSLPIFSGGKNIANLKNANIQKQIEIINYEKAIQVAFREALDQLSQHETIAKQLQMQNKILQAKNKSYKMAQAQNKVGAVSKLNNLDVVLTTLTAKQNQLITKKDYIANLIVLYKVMGGGSDGVSL